MKKSISMIMKIFNTYNINNKSYNVFKLFQILLSSTNNHKLLIQMHFFNSSNNKLPKQKAYQIQNLQAWSTSPHLIQLTSQNNSTHITNQTMLDPVRAAKHRLHRDNSNKCLMYKAIIGKSCISIRNSFNHKIRPGWITHSSLLLKKWLSCNNSKSTKNNKGRRWRDIIKQQWWMEHLCQM